MTEITGTTNLFDTWVLKHGALALGATPDLRILLLDDTLEPDQAADEFVDDISANEVSGGGYARVDCTNAVLSQSGSNGQAILDSDNPVITASGGSITARWWVLYLHVTNDADSPLICYGLIDNTPANVTIEDSKTLTLAVPLLGFLKINRV